MDVFSGKREVRRWLVLRHGTHLSSAAAACALLVGFAALPLAWDASDEQRAHIAGWLIGAAAVLAAGLGGAAAAGSLRMPLLQASFVAGGALLCHLTLEAFGLYLFMWRRPSAPRYLAFSAVFGVPLCCAAGVALPLAALVRLASLVAFLGLLGGLPLRPSDAPATDAYLGILLAAAQIALGGLVARGWRLESQAEPVEAVAVPVRPVSEAARQRRRQSLASVSGASVAGSRQTSTTHVHARRASVMARRFAGGDGTAASIRTARTARTGSDAASLAPRRGSEAGSATAAAEFAETPLERILERLDGLCAQAGLAPGLREELEELRGLLQGPGSLLAPALLDDAAAGDLDPATRQWLRGFLPAGSAPPGASRTASTGVKASRLKGSSHAGNGGRGSLGGETPRGLGGPVEAEVGAMLGRLDEWGGVDALRLDELAGRPLQTVGMAILHRHGLVDKLSLDEGKLLSFLAALEASYLPVPYHCGAHAADVAQNLHVLLTASGLAARMTELELLAALVAALGHDADHPGLNNGFHVACGLERALTHNDLAVLENHHASTLFRILRQPANDFMQALEVSQRREFRRIAVSLILATDMASHFRLLGEFRGAQAQGKLPSGTPGAPPSEDEAEGVELALRIALKCADVGASAKGPKQAAPWTLRILHEFFAQGDREKELGMDVSPFMDRAATSVPKSQLGFLAFIVTPLMAAFADAFPACGFAVEGAVACDAFWRRLDEAPAPAPGPGPALGEARLEGGGGGLRELGRAAGIPDEFLGPPPRRPLMEALPVPVPRLFPLLPASFRAGGKPLLGSKPSVTRAWVAAAPASHGEGAAVQHEVRVQSTMTVTLLSTPGASPELEGSEGPGVIQPIAEAAAATAAAAAAAAVATVTGSSRRGSRPA